jgi:hypothetical protein
MAMKCRYLSLLLNSAARRCRRAAVDSLGAAASAFLFGRTLVIVAAVVIVIIDVHLARCRLVHWCRLRRWRTLFLFPWRRRHAWRRRLADGLHGRQTLRCGGSRRVVCGLRWVVRRRWALLVHSPHLRRATIGWCRHLHRLRGRTLHLNLVKPRT